MADIFISYSKADHALALKLSAFLEAEGWSVWWDKSLGAADLYRDEIMKQLVAARAVISIWTENSVRSDWVRAEAGRAKADGKLIPVKTADVAYADIPLPFGEMHTENLEASQLIRAAVVAQLAKPAVEPSAAALLTKGFKYELLTWVGIVGGALTLFGHMSSALTLADWARLLVQGWKEWTHAFWLWGFGWLGIHLSSAWSLVLTFLSFASLLTIGQAVKFMDTSKNQSNADLYSDRSFRLMSRRTLFCLVLIMAAYCVFIVLIVVLAMLGALGEFTDEPSFESSFIESSSPVVTVVAILSMLFAVIAPWIITVLFARHRLHAALSVFLFFIFANILVVIPGGDEPVGASAGIVNWFTAIVLPVILLSVAPAKAVSRRLIFLALGLLLLIALNELSKFGFDVTAPKSQG